MKAFKSQSRAKGSRKKPNFLLSPSMFSHVPHTDELEDLKFCLPEADEEIAWAFEDKNEKEMKAVEDLCALSDGSQIIDNDRQQAWLKSIVLPKREISTTSKETHSLSLRISKREGMRLGVKSPKKTDRDTARIVPQLKLDETKPSRDFIKENVLLRNRISKQQETIIRGQIQKLLNGHQAEICTSLTASKDEISERNPTNEVRENDEDLKPKKQKSIFASTYHSREPSWQERLLQGISHRNSTRPDDENYEDDKEKGKRFMNQSIDLKAISTPKDFRPRSTGRAFENFRAPANKISNQEAFELIERYEQINGVKTRNASKLRPQSESQSRRIKPKIFKGSSPPYPPLELKIDGINNRNRSLEQEKPVAPKGKILKASDRQARRSNTLNIETAQPDPIIPQSMKKEKEKEAVKEDPIEKVNTMRKTKLGSKQVKNLRGLDFHFLITKDASLAPNSFIEIQEDVYPAHRRLKSQMVEAASPSLRTFEERERIRTTEMSIMKTQEHVQPLSARSHGGLHEGKKGSSTEMYELYKKVEKDAFRAVDHLDKIDTCWKAPDNFQVHSTRSTNRNRPSKAMENKNTNLNRPVAPPLIVNYRTLTISEQQKSPRTVILKATRGKIKS